MTIPEYDEECDCDLCKSIRAKGRSTELKPVKAKSVRSQRSFQEHMQSLYGKIDSLVYAAEVACNYLTKDGKCDAPVMGISCPFLQNWRADRGCKLPTFRMQLGDHVIQSDIETVELSE